jgi:hypothetical protein
VRATRFASAQRTAARKVLGDGRFNCAEPGRVNSEKAEPPIQKRRRSPALARDCHETGLVDVQISRKAVRLARTLACEPGELPTVASPTNGVCDHADDDFRAGLNVVSI